MKTNISLNKTPKLTLRDLPDGTPFIFKDRTPYEGVLLRLCGDEHGQPLFCSLEKGEVKTDSMYLDETVVILKPYCVVTVDETIQFIEDESGL